MATSESHYSSKAASQPPGPTRGAFLEHERMRSIKLRVRVNLPDVLLNLPSPSDKSPVPDRKRVAAVTEQLWWQSLLSLPLAQATHKSCQ